MTEAQAVVAVIEAYPGATVICTTQAVVDEVLRIIDERRTG